MKKQLLLLFVLGILSTYNSQTNILPSSGHAGIGTTNPGAPLEIATTLTPGAIVFKFSNSQQTDQILFKDRDYAKFLNGIEANKLLLGVNGYDNKIMSSTTNGNNIEFWPTLAINSTSNILINPGQYVGIGNATPQHMLDVTGNIKTSASLLVGSDFLLNGSTGSFQNTAWAGAANRILFTDANGNVSPLAAGNANQVLYGNGVWGNLPAALSSFSATGNTLYIANTTSLGIGTNNPQYPLDVAGDARIGNNLYVGGGIVITDHVRASESVTTSVLQADSIKMDATRAIYGATRIEGDIDAKNKLSVSGNATFDGNLKLSSLAGSPGVLQVDNAGTIFRGTPIISCVPGSPLWSVSGDNFVPYSTQQGNFTEASIGTCNNYDFILKSNAVNRAWFQTDGTVSFGAKIISNTGGPEYKFDQGALRLSGNNTYGGPQVVFQNLLNSPYGDWAVEYTGGTSAPNAGLNFWKPYLSTNSNNNILFLHDNNRIGMGTDNPTSRLTIDAWSDDGLLVKSDPNKNAVSVFNKNNNASVFNVLSNGYTEINVYAPNNMPQPTGGSPRAFAIMDKTNNKDLFVVNANGKIYSREVEISLATTFPDYVFAKDYKLRSLSEVEAYINKNKHLPHFEKGEYYEKNGINVTDLLLKQQKTIEELMLYNIELEKKSIEVEKQNIEILKRLKALENNK